jgi:hypothetical protein
LAQFAFQEDFDDLENVPHEEYTEEHTFQILVTLNMVLALIFSAPSQEWARAHWRSMSGMQRCQQSILRWSMVLGLLPTLGHSSMQHGRCRFILHQLEGIIR